jgi:hypothetical protein
MTRIFEPGVEKAQLFDIVESLREAPIGMIAK